MDRIARMAQAQKDDWARRSAAIDRVTARKPYCMTCGRPARLYPHGWRCDEHAPGKDGT